MENICELVYHNHCFSELHFLISQLTWIPLLLCPLFKNEIFLKMIVFKEVGIPPVSLLFLIGKRFLLLFRYLIYWDILLQIFSWHIIHSSKTLSIIEGTC